LLKLNLERAAEEAKTAQSTAVLPAHIGRRANVDDPTLLKFVADTHESCFLLGKDIQDYLWSLYVKGLELQTLFERLYHSDLRPGEERMRVAHEKAELLVWFARQFEVAREKFAKRLGLDR
jgi:hypothetical protein